MSAASGPRHLSQALSELIALKGLARVRGDAQLAEIWRRVVGDKIADRTKVLRVRRGILNVAVANAPLMSELAAFHRPSILKMLQEEHADLKIRDVKFRLKGDLPPHS